MKYDFSGYVTKNDLKCSDGVTIKHNAFKDCDGKTVPLLWQHDKSTPENVLGHVLLENRSDGVYGYAKLNASPLGITSKELVTHGDINSFSIFANKIRKAGMDVVHGMIREVSLVVSGANPGALVDYMVMEHSDSASESEEAIIYSGEIFSTITHADGPDSSKDDDDQAEDDDDNETVADVMHSLTDKQRAVVFAMLGQVLDSKGDNNTEGVQHEDGLDSTDKEGTTVRHNIFENQGKNVSPKETTTLTHSQIQAVFAESEAKKQSLEETILAHADEYGITNIEELFPEPKMVRGTPDWIKRQTEWVANVISGTTKSPFSRIKSMSADITLDTARAKGYVKGSMKKEEFFAVAKRETTPKTIYKKQKLDRDDIIDITSFDVVVWIKAEMRIMLEEEIARAILIGDGREIDDPDKIDETKIRPIATDDPFYTHQVILPANTTRETMVDELIRARQYFKGTGQPTWYTTEAELTELLLIRNGFEQRVYKSAADLNTEIRAKETVLVEAMEGFKNSDNRTLVGLLVNISDYTWGADRGGETTFFDDFDIDWNQYKYLYETRMSGALTLPKSAVAVWRAGGAEVTPAAPTYDLASKTVTVPTVAGVTYQAKGVTIEDTLVLDAKTVVRAVANDGFYFKSGSVTSWTYDIV